MCQANLIQVFLRWTAELMTCISTAHVVLQSLGDELTNLFSLKEHFLNFINNALEFTSTEPLMTSDYPTNPLLSLTYGV